MMGDVRKRWEMILYDNVGVSKQVQGLHTPRNHDLLSTVATHSEVTSIGPYFG